MKAFSFNITKVFSVDLSLFRKIRAFSDGISFCELVCNLDLYEGDHKPEFRLSLTVFNFTLLEFSVYNRFHMNKGGKDE